MKTFSSRLWPSAALLATLVAGFGGLQWGAERRRARADAVRRLETLADREAFLIRDWVEGDLIDLDGILHATARNRALAETLIQTYLRRSECLSVQYYDRAGRRLIGVFREKAGRAVESREDLARALAVEGATLRFQWDPVLNRPVFVLAKASRAAGEAAGTVFLRVDPSLVLYKILIVPGTMSRSEETLLLRVEGDRVVFLNELRHRSGSALRLSLPLSSTPRLLGAVLAHGETPDGSEVDYRGRTVLGVGRAIPGTDWTLVAKVDADEVYGPVDASYRRFLLVSLGAILLAFAAFRHSLLRAELEHAKLLQESERERRALADRLEQLSRHANDIILVLDKDLRLAYANEKAVSVYGYRRDELLGMSLDQLRAPEAADALRRQMDEVRRRGGMIYETVHRRRDQTAFPVEASAFAQETPTGWNYLEIVRDVTERKRAEAEILRLNSDLEERVRARTTELDSANKELVAFTYTVSHDLRAPLRAVDGFAQILMEDYAPKLEPEGVRYLAIVRKSAQAMGRLIDDLLAFSRLGRQVLTKGPVSMEEVVRAAVESLAPQSRGRKVSFKIGALAPCEGDYSLLKQVWINLLSNALKFTRTRPEAVIEIESRDEAGETVYRVKDNGAGFDMRHVDKLFKVFERLHRETEYEGTGVGLAIVARIVARHGGRVWARGELDHGAEFAFTLGAGGHYEK
ncbi:MAG: ATP-binding protein [Elusimicrobiota bacterium]